MWFKQFKAIFKNSFKVSASDPFYLVISLALVLLMVLSASMPSIGEGEHLRLVRDQTHSILFLCGALAGVFSIIRVVTDDIRRGSGAVLMSRPLSGLVLLSGKLAGVLGGIGILMLTGCSAYLWVTEITHDHEALNMASLTVYLLIVLLSLVAGAARQYIFGSNFSLCTSLSLSVLMAVGVLMRMMMGGMGDFDVTGLQSVVLLFMGLVIFCASVQVVAVIVDSTMVLGSAIIIFFFGLISTYLTSSFLGDGLGLIISSLLPNWQMFWILEKLGQGELVPLMYFGQCFLQTCLQLGLYLLISNILFDRIEIKGVA
jgi:hypothetical protein